MRYFKWGVSRLILESEPCPDVVPIWIEGFDQVMHESRQFPRPVPRAGKSVSVTFGQEVDLERTFGDLRARWRSLVQQKQDRDQPDDYSLGELPEELKTCEEAVQIRRECTMRVRKEVQRLRTSRGWPEEDPKAGAAETRREEGETKAGREGKMQDGSWIKDT